jgi:dihydroorotate dehydrogenase
MNRIIFKFLLLCLRLLPAELSHSIFIFTARYFWFLMPKLNIPQVKAHFFGNDIKNYYGVAAGLDKNAQAIRGLFKMGFGFVEVGTVTPRPQNGNKKPRIFRFIKQKSLLNFMGFPNNGGDYVLKMIKKYKRKNNEILGVNIGRNKDGTNADYLLLIDKFNLHCDFITINISSPNTPNLRDTLNNNHMLEELLSSIDGFCTIRNISTPILLKISPDVTNIQEIYDISCKHNIAGFILTNTTIDKAHLPDKFKNSNMGGVSGLLLKEKSESLLKQFQSLNDKNKFVISVGGIFNNADAESRVQNGANAVQIYTSLIYGAFL